MSPCMSSSSSSPLLGIDGFPTLTATCFVAPFFLLAPFSSQIGHALHDLDPVLKRYSYETRVGQVSRAKSPSKLAFAHSSSASPQSPFRSFFLTEHVFLHAARKLGQIKRGQAAGFAVASPILVWLLIY